MIKNSLKFLLILCFASILSVFFFFISGEFSNGMGLPFDDAWIHQVYARNFAQSGLIAYNSGEITLGESSYFWMLILSVGALMGMDPVVFSLIMGSIIYILSQILVFKIIGLLVLKINNKIELKNNLNQNFFIFIGSLTISLNPVLIWMFFNGMATGITILFVLLSFYAYITHHNRLLILTLPILFLCRGETIFYCIGLVLSEVYYFSPNMERNLFSKKIFKKLLMISSGLILSVFGYFIYHLIVSGQFFTNTFYLKVSIFSNLTLFLNVFYPSIFFSNLIELFNPENLVFSLFFLFFIVEGLTKLLKREEFQIIRLSVLILCLFSFMSSMEFPSVNLSPYYLKYWIFILPVVQILVIVTIFSILNKKNIISNRIRIEKIKKILLIAFMSGILFFNALEFKTRADQYREHVFEINNQHKAIGLWLEENTTADAIIATHDAGAIKFFSLRYIVDIWALNNQDIFQIYANVSKIIEEDDLNDEEASLLLEDLIWEYLFQIGTDYLVIRDDLFQHLTNETLHTELEFVQSFITVGSSYLGNDVMNLYKINY